ncbi:MAG: cytochrome-c oxidase, cbb3-type subunit III [Hydrogenophilaceae bacterium]|nr:cytochrome-c oxidase, cbb3-type subunit III [Hydrogenophilaceae bacterium]
MPDFISEFWHYYIAAITVISIIGIIWFLKSQTTRKLAVGEEAELMAPTWDGNLQELNNPLPRWWLYLFYFLIVFSIAYLVLYPGLGKFEGSWNWSSADAYQEEKARVDARFNAQFQPFLGMDLKAVAADPKAREMGQRLFMAYCSTCHGTDGKGAKTSRLFPDLTDNEWLFGGGDPEAIKASIAYGRVGEMPPMQDALGGAAGVKEVAHYVLSLSGKPHDTALAAAGQAKWAACAGCHGEDGKGNLAISAPDLTDKAWLYSGTEAGIMEAISKGRKGGMPAQLEHLGEAKVHLLTGYVMSLSQSGK